MAKTILIVDDEELIRWSLRERMSGEGYEIRIAEDGRSANEILDREAVDLVLLDLRLPDMDGTDILRRIRSVRPDLPVIIMTAYSSVETAVEGMKLGAYDYLPKPFNMDDVALTVGRALKATDLKEELTVRVGAEKEKFGAVNVIGESAAIREIVALIRKLARSATTTILLRGESGTGKDLLARVIHYESARADKLFMNVSCTAIPDTLLESELFGHEKGAFTDARKQKKGFFELADGGSVFLDEVGDMSPALQSRLLHVVEYKSFKRIGGADDIHVDVRIIGATNRDLEKAIEEQAFREDLYYRFNVMPIYVPPLRERAEDVPLLADFFLKQFGHEMRRESVTFADEALAKLCGYHWPGNVRELRNVIERALLLAESDTIGAQDILLGRVIRGTTSEPDPGQAVTLPPGGCSLDQVEKELVQQALLRTKGNRTRAAELLGISRDQVRYKIEKHGIEEPDSTP